MDRTSKGCFSSLPVELVLMVVDHLPLDDTLVAVAHTSSGWRKLVFNLLGGELFWKRRLVSPEAVKCECTARSSWNSGRQTMVSRRTDSLLLLSGKLFWFVREHIDGRLDKLQLVCFKGSLEPTEYSGHIVCDSLPVEMQWNVVRWTNRHESGRHRRGRAEYLELEVLSLTKLCSCSGEPCVQDALVALAEPEGCRETPVSDCNDEVEWNGKSVAECSSLSWTMHAC